MTKAQKMDVVKTFVGNVETDEMLSTYLKLAGSKIISKAYPFKNDVTEVPAEYDMLQCELAAFLINKRGAEGQTSHSENGISRGYESERSYLKQVVPRCEVF